MKRRGVASAVAVFATVAGCSGGDEQHAPPPTGEVSPSVGVVRPAISPGDPTTPAPARTGRGEPADPAARAERAALRWAHAYAAHSAEPDKWAARMEAHCTRRCLRQISQVNPAQVPFEPVDVLGADARQHGDAWTVQLRITGHRPWTVHVITTPQGPLVDPITPPVALEGDRP